MKLEINLNDILGDECGVETIQESVKRQVIQALKVDIKQRIEREIDSEISLFIKSTLKEQVAQITPNFITELMDAEYVQVNNYGDRGGKTTFRQQLAKAVQDQMCYKKTSYNDKNYFTAQVDKTVESLVDNFKTEYVKVIDQKYLQETMEFAVGTLKKRLGLA